MVEFFKKLFDSDFMPHGHCLLWRADLLALHVGSDLLIALAYYSIPLALLVIVKRRNDLVFGRMYILFALFIFLCGTTHLFDIWAIWHGTYRIEGLVKLLTGVVSIMTAYMLWRIIPRILAIPSRPQLEAEVEQRRLVQGQLEAARAELEERVQQRTAELEKANQRHGEWANIVHSSSDAIISCGLDYTILSLNPAAERLFGCRAAEAIGHSLAVHGSLWNERIQRVANQVITGSILPDFETTIAPKNRSPLAVAVTISPIFSAQHQLQGISIIARDITERKRLEERFRIAVEAAPNAMLLVNQVGRIVLANAQAEKLFGYTEAELLNLLIDRLIPDAFRAARNESMTGEYRQEENVGRIPQAHLMGKGRELFGIRKDGSQVPIEVGHTPIETSEGAMVISAIVDITERKEVHERLRNSIDQKDVLLKEIHHRVKNNLQVISSLLKLQSGYVNHPQARQMLMDSEERVRSMALVHEKLYNSEELHRVDFQAYVQELASELCRTYCVDSRPVTLELDLGPTELSIEKAIPCGLILNELLSNALKHAFEQIPTDRSPCISVGLKRRGNLGQDLELTVADNGIGIHESIDLKHVTSMGLQVVSTLCDQLKAEIRVTRDLGTKFNLVFSANDLFTSHQQSEAYGINQHPIV
jgi:PAS domain S-box-containing protein